MRKVHKERLMGALGVMLIICAVLLLLGWEKFGREALTYEPVIVFKQDVQKGTIIKRSMMDVKRIEKDNLIEQVIKDPKLIEGKRSNTFIPKGLQLSKEFFSDPQLVTGDGNNILSVPMEWIYSYPQTLRRGDLVHFYSIDRALVENGYESGAEVLAGGGAPILSVKIAYVKDSSNREVIDVTPDRIDGSAAVSNIEVVISEKQYQQMKATAESGQIFVIMYE